MLRRAYKRATESANHLQNLSNGFDNAPPSPSLPSSPLIQSSISAHRCGHLFASHMTMDDEPRRSTKRSRFDQTERPAGHDDGKRPSRFDRRSRSPSAKEPIDRRRSRSPLNPQILNSDAEEKPKPALDPAAAAGMFFWVSPRPGRCA